MAADGTIKIDILLDDGSVKKGIASLNGLENASGEAGNGIKSLSGAMGLIKAAAIAAAGSAMVAGVVKFGKAAVGAYADYEQLVGGVETLFGAGGQSVEQYAKSVGKSVDDARGDYNNLMQAQDLVMKNADNAYKTAGMSANQYMEVATSSAAAMVTSVGGDTVKAAKLTDQAVTDMADNANKMGSNITDIQNAYGGFAKGNFTMLDNLKIGYGGTQEEMKRLLSDAEKLPGAMGKKFDISNYADVTEAIYAYLTVSGTTTSVVQELIVYDSKTVSQIYSRSRSGSTPTFSPWSKTVMADDSGKVTMKDLVTSSITLPNDTDGWVTLQNLHYKKKNGLVSFWFDFTTTAAGTAVVGTFPDGFIPPNDVMFVIVNWTTTTASSKVLQLTGLNSSTNTGLVGILNAVANTRYTGHFTFSI